MNPIHGMPFYGISKQAPNDKPRIAIATVRLFDLTDKTAKEDKGIPLPLDID
jgi:hypothetical protein